MVAVVSADISIFALLQICGRYQHLIFGQLIGNRLCSHTVKYHLINPADYISRFLINQKMIFIFRVSLIAVWNCSATTLAVLHSCFEHSSDFVTCILGIPFIHDVHKRCEIIICRVCTVNSVIDGNETDTLIRKKHFRIEADFQIVTTEP